MPSSEKSQFSSYGLLQKNEKKIGDVQSMLKFWWQFI